MSPVSARVLAALVAAGATPEQLIAAVAAEENAAAERKDKRREKWRLDKRRLRSKPCPPMSTETTVDGGGPPSFSPTPPLSPPVVVGGGGGGARAHEATDQARALADDILIILAVGGDHQGNWDVEAMTRWLLAGFAGGWHADVVRIAARRVAAQRRGQGPPGSYRYLEKPIVREHELAARPVPTVNQEQTHALQRELTLVRPVAGFAARKDDFRNAHAELDDYVRRQRGGGNGGQ